MAGDREDAKVRRGWKRDIQSDEDAGYLKETGSLCSPIQDKERWPKSDTTKQRVCRTLEWPDVLVWKGDLQLHKAKRTTRLYKRWTSRRKEEDERPWKVGRRTHSRFELIMEQFRVSLFKWLSALYLNLSCRSSPNLLRNWYDIEFASNSLPRNTSILHETQ